MLDNVVAHGTPETFHSCIVGYQWSCWAVWSADPHFCPPQCHPHGRHPQCLCTNLSVTGLGCCASMSNNQTPPLHKHHICTPALAQQDLSYCLQSGSHNCMHMIEHITHISIHVYEVSMRVTIIQMCLTSNSFWKRKSRLSSGQLERVCK